MNLCLILNKKIFVAFFWHTGKAGLGTHGLEAWTLDAWTLDAWTPRANL